MKKNVSGKPMIITSIALISMFAIAFLSCKNSDRKFYKTHSGKVVTIWNDYIIFEKYEGKEPPKNKYILQKGQYHDSDIDLVFKDNDSIIIFRRIGKDSIDIVFSQPDYKLEIYNNTWEEFKEFEKRTSFSDTLVIFELNYCPNDKIVMISECIGELVYTRDYGRWPRFYKEYVHSRYDEMFDNRVF